MNTRQIIVIFCLFAVFFSALSIASASDVDNMIVSVANDENTIDTANSNNEILTDSPNGTFVDLEGDIETVPEAGNLPLEKNYTYDGVGQTINISKDMTIDGQGHTIDADGQIAIFNITNASHVILKNIRFANGHGENGSAIKVNPGSSVEIINCTFINNTATNFGGAIYIVADGSGIISKITDSIFEENKAYNGGAIYSNSNKAIIEGTTFTGNRADNDGAGVYVAGDNCNLANSTFTDNIAGDDGPAVYWQGSNGIMYNLTCSGNRGLSEIDPKEGDRSTSKGGTICLTGSNVTVKKSSFANSLAGYNGGALFITGNNDNVIDCIFDNCTARDENGGVLYIIGNHTNVLNCNFENCNANLSGGVIYVNGSYATINKASFTNNGANLDGAALYVAGHDCVLANSTFTDNIAGDDGGAVYWEGDNGTLYNITCKNNKGISDIDPIDKTRSNSKGGTICLTGSNVTIEKSNFTQSSVVVDGGALFITGNYVNVIDCIFDNCTSTNRSGGAVYIIGNNTNISNCDFKDCAAYISGGVIYVEGNNATIDHATFTDNKANLDGAAVYIAGDDCILADSTFTRNTAGDDGGAVYWEGDNGIIYNITCENNKGISDIDPTDGTRSNSKGGTICLTGSNVTVNKSSFTHSSAVVDGGALFITGNNVNVVNSVFEDCTSANSGGGAIYIIGNYTSVSNCTFDDCSVNKLDPEKHRGGAIFVEGNNANISDSNFTNTQGLVGGAIYIEGNDTIVDNSVFNNNIASGLPGGSGGAIHVQGAGAIISNSEFSQGTAVNYGGALSIWGPNAVIVNNTFDQSKTTKLNGGAVFVKGENATISLSNFTKCNALGDQYARGGAIEVEGNGTNILDCNFDDCDSHFGGVIHVSGTDAFIGGSTFKNSEAYQGGAIYVDGVNTTISKSNFTDIIARDYGGAIYVAGANANISQSNFLRSKVTNYNGGAVYIKGENTNIEKSNFTSAQALNSRNKALGGAIYIEGPNAVVNGSNFDDCKAYEGGGSIYAYGNSAKIDDSTFDSSTAKSGGAIYLTAWGASVTRSNVSNCNATENGGGIYVAEGSIHISESNFDDCVAKGTSVNNGGGAIYINGPDTHISASNFTSNNVPGTSARGGSIFIKGERTIIEGSEFDWGKANQGGEIFIEGADAVIDTSKFVNSSSRSSGGSIFVKGDEATIRNSSFDNISAKNNGGAIFVDGKKTNILDSSFYNCTVGMSYKGGAIYIDDVGTTIDHSNFTLSKSGNGGAIYINGRNTTISYCNLHNNSANTAGAIKVYGDDTVISNSNFTYNNALNGAGGSMDIGGANASVYYSWFDHNVAKMEGGAINWLGGHGDDSIIGSTFTNNVAHNTQRGGGAIYWTHGNVIASGGLIKDSIFINNTATGRHGGAINWFHALDSVIDNCLFINNTANRDGGALYTGDQGGQSVNLTITNSQFYNNTALKYGGAISNQMSNSYIYNNIFDGNTARAGGGSILMKEGPAKNSVIDHCYIYNSHVGDLAGGYGEGGGAILLGVSGDSNITISNCAILNSTIERGPGGAIAIFGSDCSLINVSIEDASTQNDDGGAIYWKGQNGKLDNVTIFNASSNSLDGTKSSNGGAIYLYGWNSNLNDIKIFKASANNDENCQKTNYGGAIYVYGSNEVLTNITIDNATSSNVKMNGAGGAIYVEGYNVDLINATISNTFASGNGGAIYWKGGAPLIDNVSITYSQTNVTNSANTADGGAIYSTSITELNNVHIRDAIAYKDSGEVRGGAIYLLDGKTLNNVTVIDSRAFSGSGTSYGGAIYLERKTGSNTIWVYNSSLEENNADLGGGLYFNKLTGRIYNTSFTGNVANRNGGALYCDNDGFIEDSNFTRNSAKNGGAIFTQNAHIQVTDSSLEFNTAEEKGGALYHNFTGTKTGSSLIKDSDLINNTAFQGSAIYATRFYRFSLENDVLLDNQANSNKFIEKAVGVDEEGNNYTSAVFVGFDNLLNAIWQEDTATALSCNNVTYWGVDGKTIANGAPTRSDREVNINVTVEMYDDRGAQITTVPLVTDKDGRVKYNFDAEDGKTYYFAYVHKSDRYYTYLRDTLSNSSLVNIYVYTPIYYSQNQTVLIELTDGAWGNLNGTVTVTFNDTKHTTFDIEVVNGTGVKYNITDLDIGHYNATASFAGDINHTGDTDWVLFEVLPYNDLEIKKVVNITAEYVNVTDVIRYEIEVTNHGPSKAYEVNVTEVLSPYLKLLRSKATHGNYNATGGYWYIGELDDGDFETLTIVAEIIHMGPITNTVWVTGYGKDINETNNVDSAHNFTAVPIVDLRILKDVNVTTDVINVLDVIKFNITVFNDGPCNATGVIVEELIDDHLEIISNTTTLGTYSAGTWNIGNMANGTNATLTIVARVVYSGNISNAVHVSGFENETNYTNNHASIKNMTAVANVDLKITKEVNVTGVIHVFDIIKFVITVTNNGPCNATGVYVGETLSPHLRMISNTTTIGKYDGTTWLINNLNKGVVHNLTIIAEVISAGNISNAVAIFGNPNDNDTNKSNNNDSIKNITAIDVVDLEINKTVDVTSGFVNVTDTIVFSIVVRNKGPSTATNVNVSEVLSPHLKMDRYSTWDSYYNVTEGVWHIGTLTKGDWRELVIVAHVISAGTISNVVIVNSTENDTNTSNNRDEIPNITALPIVDLQIKKESNFTGDVINVTDSIKYTITVFNDGPCNATNVNVSEVLSPHLKLIKNETEFGYYNVTEGIWYIGDLNNQSTAVLTIYAKVISSGIISNVVVVNSTENDTNPYNNRDAVKDIAAVDIVDLRITKEVNTDRTDIDITETLIFTIKVYNAGPCNATGVYVAEPLSDILVLVDNVTATGNWDGYTWYIGNLTSGSEAKLIIIAKIAYAGIVENEVNVTCNEIDTNLSNNKDNITPIRVSAHIDIAINKTVNVTTGVVNVSDLVEFTITAYNNGPCNASGVYVLEALDPLLEEVSHIATPGTTYDGYTWYIGNLDADDNATLTIVARVMGPGNFSNYVKIFGYGNDTNLSNNNYTIPNITARPVVDLEIAKEVNVTTGVVEFGDTIMFNITVRNNGPCEATNVNVSEVLSPHLNLTKNETEKGYYNVTEGIWYIGNLAKDEWCKLVIVAKVISVGNITNVVNVTSTENDTNKSNNNASIPNITAIPIVDLQINKTVNVTSKVIYVLDEIKYTITVFNAGPCNATNVNVSEVLSPHLKLVKNETKNGYYDVDKGIWYIGNLTNKSTAVLNITAKVMSPGTISNVVIVNSTEKDTNLSNNKAEISNITADLLFDLQINKTVNTTVDVGVTDVIKFVITVYNAGPCNATDVYVSESLSDKLSLMENVTSVGKWNGTIWYIGNLTNGASANLTIVARIAYSGIIENVVIVTGNGTDTNMSNNKDEITPLNATIHVDLGVNKTANVTGIVNVTDLVEFNIVAYNNCSFNASGVYVLEALDPLLEEVSHVASEGTTYNGRIWNIGYLNAGANVTLKIVARVIKPGNFSNYVKITGNDPDTNLSNNNDTIPNITAVPIVDLSITKVTDVTNNTVNYNDTIRFTITVVNKGPCEATNVNVSEVLSPHLKLINNETDKGYYNVTEGIWYIGNLTKDDWCELVIEARVTSVGNITNVVNVTSTENDTNISNNNASIPNITVRAIVDLKINKTVNVTVTDLAVTDVIKFTLTVVNDGPCNATNVYIREPLSDKLEMYDVFYNATTGEMQCWNASKGIYKDKYTWVIGNMTVGDKETLTIVAKIVYSGVIENEVYVTSNDVDINESNNYDSINPITATTQVDLAINKTVNVTTGVVNVSDMVEFTITAYNYGPCNASGVYVLEALDSHLREYSHVASPGTTYDGYTWYIGYLDAGANATLTIVATVVEQGNFSNYVEIFGYDPDTNSSNNNATIPNITARPLVDLEISKEVNVQGNVTYVGDSVVFTITVKNKGPSDATNVNVSEVLSPHLDLIEYITWDSYYDVDAGVWYIGDLARYDWRQLIIITEVTSVGNISNVVNVTSTENDTNISNNNASIPNITALPVVDLQITKDVDVASGYVKVYDFFKYTITVFNAGPYNATNVNVSEKISPYLKLIKNETEFGYYNVSEGIWHIGDLAAGSYANLTLLVKVMVNGTVIPNVVTVNSTEKDTDPYNNRDEVTIAVLPVVDLRITKEVNVTSEIGVTDLIRFVVTVYNDGPCEATGIYVIESLSDKLRLISNVTSAGNWDGYTWNIPKLANGTNATLTIIAQVIYAGNISNVVVAHAYQNETNYTNNNASIPNITAIINADLQITKKVNVTVVNVTDLIEFIVTVRNNGPCDASGVIVGETLDSHLEHVSNTTSVGDWDGFTWNIGNLTNQSSAVLTIVARVVSAGNISNVVAVSGSDNDTNTSNNVANITNVTALPVVDLRVNKTVNVTTANVTDLIKYTIVVVNNGPSKATDVVVCDKLVSQVKFVSFDASRSGITYDNVTGEAKVGNLDAGEKVVLTVVARILSVGTIQNTVNVTSNENDTNKSNNNGSCENVTALPAVDIGVNKTVNVTVANVTDLIKYTITVRNDGPCNATGVNVVDKLSNLVEFVSFESTCAGITYNNITGISTIGNLDVNETVILTIVARIISNGILLDNVVTVNSTEKDINPYNNRDEVTVAVLPIVDLRITKEANVTSEIGVTDLIKFVVTVYNDGPCEATGIFVKEELSSMLRLISNVTSVGDWDGSTWNIPKLANGTNATLTIIAQVIYAGNISNVVVAHAYQNETNYTNNNASIPNITAVINADLQITKKVNVSVVNVYDLIEFIVTVRNNGPCDASGVIVGETLDSHLEHVSNTTSVGDWDGFTWNIGNLTNQSSAVLTIVARVVSVGNISNVVAVSGSDNDTNTSNNVANITNVTALPVVDLRVNKTVNVTAANVTDLIKYTIVVVNNGPCNATGVNVVDKLSNLVEFVSFESTRAGITYNDITGIFTIGNLDVDETVILTIVARIISNGTIENVVFANSTENDTNKSNNNGSCENVTALPIVDIGVNKTVNVTVANVTDLIKYTITVRNDGPCNATGVNVVDKLSNLVEFVSFESTRAGITYNDITGISTIGNLDVDETVVLTIVARIISNGTIENVVFANSTENDTNKSNNNGSSENVTGKPIVDLIINKTASVKEARIGEEFTYVITVRNNGPSNATNVNVLEKLSGNVVLVQKTPSKGDYDSDKNIWHIGLLGYNQTATLTLVVKVISNGTIENVVIVNSTENDTNKSNNNYTCDNVTVIEVNIPIELITYNITYGEDEIITVILPNGATGTVNITVGNDTYPNLVIDEGKVTLPLIDLAGGNYTVDVVYGGDGYYGANSTSGTFNVARVVPIIKIEVEDIWVGEIEIANVTVNAPGVVYVTIYNRTVEISLENGVVTTDVLKATRHSYLGNATWNLINLPVGAYPAYALYPGNENYTSVDTRDLFHVRDKQSTVVVTADDIYVGEDAVIHIKVGPKGLTGNVTVTLEGKPYIVPLDNNSEAILVVSGLKAGTKNVTVEYNGTALFKPSENSTTFNVLKLKPSIDIEAPEITIGEDGEIIVYVPDDATGTITIEIEGNLYTADIEDGMAIFIVPGLKVGVHDIAAYYSGDDKYLSASTIGSIKVNPLKENKTDNGTTVHHGGIWLSKYPTGNPIIALLLVIISIGFVKSRRFKK